MAKSRSSNLDASAFGALERLARLDGGFVEEKGSPDLNVITTRGLAIFNALVAEFKQTADGVAITAATAGQEKLAIVTLNVAAQTLAVTEGSEVASGAGTAALPAVPSGHFLLASIGSGARPIRSTTTKAVNSTVENIGLILTEAVIDNKVRHDESLTDAFS